ncbi:AAA family ATPase [Candidatus Villigracilis saccharophilus]|jgi:adenylate kinase family enzyme|uniref:AAA family ATPase n=1 Tax=Candidatus Villigracilis saccharophilus TaxID=3140684 RepID=UPI0031F157BC
MNTFRYKRIVVIGTTSSGKSTLAKRLAEKIGGDFIELDALHWESDWVEAKLKVFRERVETATGSQVWVVAGNYHVVRDLIWPKAQAVIWLDYSFSLVFWRLLTRTIRRWVTQEELWNGNREQFWGHFKIWSEESLFHWLFKSYWRRKRETPQLLALTEHVHLKVFHFQKPNETENWLKNI